MLVLDPQNISKSGGLYNLNADQNLAELKAIMKDLLVKEVPSSDRPAMWASDKPYSAKKVESTQLMLLATNGRSQNLRLDQAFGLIKRKKRSVKTFAL